MIITCLESCYIYALEAWFLGHLFALGYSHFDELKGKKYTRWLKYKCDGLNYAKNVRIILCDDWIWECIEAIPPGFFF